MTQTLFFMGIRKKKKYLNTMMLIICVMGSVLVRWIILVYSLSCNGDNLFIENFNKLFLNGVSLVEGAGISEELFPAFQIIIALITTAFLTGSVVDRLKVSAVFTFIAVWLFGV